MNRVIHFMAKAEMRAGRCSAGWRRQSAVYFVRRGEGDRAAQRFALEALAAGRPIAIFPEGTRSRDGHLKAGKSGAALLAMRSGAPLLPVGISGTHRIFPDGSKLPHPTRIVIRIGEPFRLPHQPDRPDRPGALAGGDRADHGGDRGAPAGEQRRVT